MQPRRKTPRMSKDITENMFRKYVVKDSGYCTLLRPGTMPIICMKVMNIFVLPCSHSWIVFQVLRAGFRSGIFIVSHLITVPGFG